MGVKFYSYRNASTGSSLDAFLAGYKPKRTHMTIPKMTAPNAHQNGNVGVMHACMFVLLMDQICGLAVVG